MLSCSACLDLDDESLSAMHASALSGASDIERHGNPRCDARKQYLSRGMPRTEALNEQPVITCWTAEPKSEGDGDAVTDDENGKRHNDEPRPAEEQDSNHAHKKNCEPATRPHNEPRLSIEAAGDGLLDGVHTRPDENYANGRVRRIFFASKTRGERFPTKYT